VVLYDGPINERTMDEDAFRGYVSWKQQRQRCYNPKNNRYKYVGAKGIEVEYSAREFIGWWLAQIKKKRLKHPACGRIDHAQNYRFDNIEMVERADNTRERLRRCGPPIRSAPRILADGPGGMVLKFMHMGELARVTGAPRHLLEAHLDGKIDSPVPYFRFRYA
jgi:hypothetical protein